MKDLSIKFNLLNRIERQEVIDFIDFLLKRKKKRNPELSSEYRKKILNVSTWTDADLAIFKKNQEYFNEWKIEEW